MADDELHKYRKTPPETDEDWQRLHRALDRADKAWIVTGPAAAFAVNWRGWAFALGLLLVLRRNELPAILDMLTGAGK